MIEAAQRKAQLEQQNRTEGNQQLIQGLQSIGQIGQSLVDKRMKVAQALSLGKQFGIPEDQTRLMEPDQILKAAAVNKGQVDMQMLMTMLKMSHGGTPTGDTAMTSPGSSGATPVSGPSATPSNGAILTSNTTATPLSQVTPLSTEQAPPVPVPIQAPPAVPKMVNKATADMAYKMANANRIDPVVTRSEAAAAGGVKHGTLILNDLNPGLTASWETATPQQQALAKAMYEGRVRPSDLSFRERGVTTTLANEYAGMNGLPPFKAYNADVNATMAKFATSGKLGQNALSLNTALGHAASSFDSFQAIQNTNQEWLNQPINKLKKITNDPNVVALGINLNALQGELANVFKNSGATDQEISHWKEYLNENLTPQQYVGALGKIDELLKSRLSAMEYQQSTAGGGGRLISPHAEDISNRLSKPMSQTHPAEWNDQNEQRLQMLLEKKAKGTLKG